MADLDSDERGDLADSKFAFPTQRKEPLEDASHVRNAIARFDQIKGVSDDERDEALAAHPGSGEEVRRRAQRGKLARAGQEALRHPGAARLGARRDRVHPPAMPAR